MTAELAFRQDICEHPDDDAPRLVYADWLDEHDQPERAEFIRVQCALAGIAGTDPRRRALEEREAELMHAHRKTWLAEVPSWARKYVDFERGFVGQVECTLARFTGPDCETLCRQAPVRRVRLLHPPAKGLAALGRSPRLAQLSHLDLNRVREEHLRCLRAWPELPRLRHLTLDINSAAAPAQELRDLLDSPVTAHLTGLGLLAPPNTWTVFLAVSPWLERLTHLGLHRGALNAQSARLLASSPHIRGLRHLDVGGCHGLGDEGVEALADSPHLANLTYLGLDTCLLSRAAAFTIAGSPHLGNLTDLVLNSSPTDDKGVQALLDSPHLGSLRCIGLFWTQVSKRIPLWQVERRGRTLAFHWVERAG